MQPRRTLLVSAVVTSFCISHRRVRHKVLVRQEAHVLWGAARSGHHFLHLDVYGYRHAESKIGLRSLRSLSSLILKIT